MTIGDEMQVNRGNSMVAQVKDVAHGPLVLTDVQL
jgi:hypothetical protein